MKLRKRRNGTFVCEGTADELAQFFVKTAKGLNMMKPDKPKSRTQLVKEFLEQQIEPVHIDAILNGIGLEVNYVNQASVTTTLRRKPELFTRTSLGHYALIQK